MPTSCFCFACVNQMDRAVVERFGKFDSILGPGCHCISPLSNVSGTVSMKVNMVEIKVDTKTKDNVLVVVSCSIHYEVVVDKIQEAFYKFSNPRVQLQAFAGNVIRGQVPNLTIDEIFLSRDEIQKALKSELDVQMASFGFNIAAALITDIDPIQAIKDSMSQINTNARLRIATAYEAEAEKIKIVKAAEADAEAKRLSGVGLAEQRKAAIAGLQSSVENFKNHVKGIQSREVMSLLLMNQYFDALKDIATASRGNVVFLAGANAGSAEVAEGMIAATAASQHSGPGPRRRQ